MREDLAILKFVPVKDTIRSVVRIIRENPQSELAEISKKFLELKQQITKSFEDINTKLAENGSELKFQIPEPLKAALADLRTQVFASVRKIAVSENDIPRRVTNSTETNKLVRILGKDVLDRIWGEVQRSEVFSLLADETMDLATIEQLAIYAKYVHGGVSKTRLIALVALSAGDAETITDAIHNTDVIAEKCYQ